MHDFAKTLGISMSAVRDLVDRGMRVIRNGNQHFVMGCDFIDFVNESDCPWENAAQQLWESGQ